MILAYTMPNQYDWAQNRTETSHKIWKSSLKSVEATRSRKSTIKVFSDKKTMRHSLTGDLRFSQHLEIESKSKYELINNCYPPELLRRQWSLMMKKKENYSLSLSSYLFGLFGRVCFWLVVFFSGRQ